MLVNLLIVVSTGEYSDNAMENRYKNKRIIHDYNNTTATVWLNNFCYNLKLTQYDFSSECSIIVRIRYQVAQY